jgi:hypothetical protein
MTWTKVDDQFHAHPKVQLAWHAHRASIGLHLLALSHSAAYLTDGHVSETFAKGQIPGAAERRRAVGALVNAGLWERTDSGWMIHDYLDFNESRAEVLARRSEQAGSRSEAGRKGARKRWEPELGSTNGEQTKLVCSPYGKQIAPGPNGKPMAPTPVPYPVNALSAD